MSKVKFLLVLICCCLQLQLASAQSAEVQQLILNIEKLAQLKSILSNMKQGYQVISKGYGMVKDVTEGNFNLHHAFLDGLLTVNPELRRYRKVVGIINYQIRIISEYKAAFGRFKNGGQFTSTEILYLARVYGNLIDRSLEQLDDLTLVLTSGSLRMSDEERIRTIDRLYEDMGSKLSFLRSFNRRAAAIAASRSSLSRDNAVLGRLELGR